MKDRCLCLAPTPHPQTHLPETMNNPPDVALCVGHSRLIKGRPEGGAVSVGGVAEWTCNCGLALQVQQILKEKRISSVVISLYQGAGYDSAQRWLAGHLRDLRVKCAGELHFNSAGPTARGHEHLHHPNSKGGKELATCLSQEQTVMLPGIPRRGVKERFKGTGSENRGWQFLYYPPMPSVIIEPGFGSNAEDWEIMSKNQFRLAEAIAEGFAAYLD